ncbi:hypothetical protein D0A34_05855 [Microcoleus vaginatus PCC 9802]|uniref:hypothetical protein n=1 Tax=Microcoleus vaginatus TaxID=119532 RepID=UPI00020D2A24|nr:hypothetical protein MicvaDRAFT_0816 [Microcoleus vaginatus FGP-2]UNU18463.1 hypothetical protein D0A34_05855 [Microcoleus vaginatus PCC 9802]
MASQLRSARDGCASFYVWAIGNKQDLLPIAVKKNQIERSSSLAQPAPTGAALTFSTKFQEFESFLHHF